MPIPNLKTPGTYLDVNINTQRTGLPANTHKVLFITNDEQPITTAMPISIYDKAKADQIYGADSEVGRMITAAIKTNRVVDVQMLGKAVGGVIDPDYPEFNGYTLTKLELLVLGGYFVIIVMGEDEYFGHTSNHQGLDNVYGNHPYLDISITDSNHVSVQLKDGVLEPFECEIYLISTNEDRSSIGGLLTGSNCTPELFEEFVGTVSPMQRSYRFVPLV